VSAKKLVLIVPGAVRVQSLLQNPEVLTNGAAGLLDQARGLPYAGKQIGVVDQVKLRRLVQSNAPSPGQLLGVTLGFILGAFLGAVPAVAIALFSSGFTQALVVAALFLLAQQLEGNILGLKIQDSSVGVHPLWVLFATLAATVLYGIFGAILAVPIVAILAATLRYLRRTPLFEGWRKPPNVMVAPEEAEPREGPAVPAESPTTGEKVSVRCFVDRQR
jgi:hypothetical protein